MQLIENEFYIYNNSNGSGSIPAKIMWIKDNQVSIELYYGFFKDGYVVVSIEEAKEMLKKFEDVKDLPENIIKRFNKISNDGRNEDMVKKHVKGRKQVGDVSVSESKKEDTVEKVAEPTQEVSKSNGTIKVGDSKIYKGRKDAYKGKPCEIIAVINENCYKVKFADGTKSLTALKSLE